MRASIGIALLSSVAACRGDSASGSIPPDAQNKVDYVEAGVIVVAPRLAGLESLFPFVLNPGSPGATGIVFTHDPTPGAPPNSYIFRIPLDGDGSGSAETSLTGSATFTGDPATAATGFGGHLTFALISPGGLGDFAGDMDFALIAAGREMSGSGTFTDALTGYTTTLSVNPNAPLILKPATGAANSQPNLCSYSLSGDVQFAVTGPLGILGIIYRFLSNRAAVTMTAGSYVDNAGATTAVPGSTVTIPCGGSGSINDWTGVFDQRWSCIPAEFGAARLTLSRSTATQVTIVDEDPPGSGSTSTYSATTVPGNPHVLRGFFIGGPPGSTYREDFTWTLRPNSATFSQISQYVYQQGPNTGSGGLCGGTATRAP